MPLPRSVIPMGSVTKSWTMAALFRVIQEGRMRRRSNEKNMLSPFTLDTKVIDFANEVGIHPFCAEKSPCRIRHTFPSSVL